MYSLGLSPKSACKSNGGYLPPIEISLIFCLRGRSPAYMYYSIQFYACQVLACLAGVKFLVGAGGAEISAVLCFLPSFSFSEIFM